MTGSAARSAAAGQGVLRATGGLAAKGDGQADGVDRPLYFSHHVWCVPAGAVSLTVVIWVTQALRDIDLMTNQGQTILVFIGITGLIVPLLVLMIAPLALVIAVAYVLTSSAPIPRSSS